MKYFTAFIIGTYCILYVTSSAIRNPDKRTKEKELSEKEHEVDEHHNPDYDHEAFLGKEEAHEFDTLTPEESKKKLAVIVDKIDTDKDGFISEKEMVAWIKYIQKSYTNSDAQRQWANYDKTEKDTLSWEEYVNRTYGEHLEEAEDESIPYKDLKERESRRFKMADVNYDGMLSYREYVDFLHPEDAEHMRDIVVMETIEDIDKDKDGFISEIEYIGDMYSESERNGEEPEWVKTEREHFTKYRDLNGDGKMDKEEVRHWIMPDDYDHAQAESKHLLYEADANKDEKLTKEEILDKYDLFVGSQATDFGEALNKNHDEF